MTRKSDKAKFVFLMLYFLILTIERIISLATVLTSDIAGYDLLDLYMSVLTAAAIIGAYTYMFLKVRFTAKPRSSDKPEEVYRPLLQAFRIRFVLVCQMSVVLP